MAKLGGYGRRVVRRTALGSAYCYEEGVRHVRVGDRIVCWRMVPWRATPQYTLCFRNAWGTEAEMAALRLEVQEYMLRRSDMPPPQGVAKLLDQGDAWALEFPVLWSFMTQDKWEDGAARMPGSMMVFVQDGVLKGMLRDKDRGCCLWCAAPGLYTLMGVMEASLLSPTAEWRVDRQVPGQTAKRIKRGG